MNRSQMYSLLLNNYVQGNVKFLAKDGKFHKFGSAACVDGAFLFFEDYYGEDMSRSHMCRMLELDEEDDPKYSEYAVKIKTYGIHGKTAICEIHNFYMDGNDLVFTESAEVPRSQVKTFEQVLAELPDEQCLEDECWYKTSDIREFLVKLKAAHESDMSELKKKLGSHSSYATTLRQKISAISKGVSNG